MKTRTWAMREILAWFSFPLIGKEAHRCWQPRTDGCCCCWHSQRHRHCTNSWGFETFTLSPIHSSSRKNWSWKKTSGFRPFWVHKAISVQPDETYQQLLFNIQFDLVITRISSNSFQNPVLGLANHEIDGNPTA